MSQSIRQLAYYVPDIDAAARAHSKTFGSGPFFVLRNIQLSSTLHRGVDRDWVHSSAYGQWGDVMIEFVTQHSAGPSAITDVFPAGSGRYGLHHTACFVDDLDVAIAEYEAQGMPLAQISQSDSGMRFAFVDATASLGHMIELYAAGSGIEEFYDMVRGASEGWNGSDPVRELGEL
ncbi:MAG: VOC family protein [Pseudomonadota bacterium]